MGPLGKFLIKMLGTSTWREMQVFALGALVILFGDQFGIVMTTAKIIGVVILTAIGILALLGRKWLETRKQGSPL